MTTEFFDDTPPKPKLGGMTRARGKRGQSGLTSLVAQSPTAEADKPPAASPEAAMPVARQPVSPAAPDPTAPDPTAPDPAAPNMPGLNMSVPDSSTPRAAALERAAAPSTSASMEHAATLSPTGTGKSAASAPQPDRTVTPAQEGAPAMAATPQAPPAAAPIPAAPAPAAPIPTAQVAATAATAGPEAPTVPPVASPPTAPSAAAPSTAPPAPPTAEPRPRRRPAKEQAATDLVPTTPPAPAPAQAPRTRAEPAPRPDRGSAARPATATSSAYQTPEQVSIYVKPEAKERARAMSRSEGIEYAQLAMDAIDHFLTENMLAFLVRARLEVSRPNGSRFPPRRNLRSKSRPGIRRVLWPVQFRPAELDILNGLVHETGAEHLSTLVSVAVEAYLLDDDGAEPGRPFDDDMAVSIGR